MNVESELLIALYVCGQNAIIMHIKLLHTFILLNVLVIVWFTHITIYVIIISLIWFIG